MDEEVVHIYNGLLLNHKKEPNSATCSNTDGPRVIILSQSETERPIPYVITYVESKI